MVRLAPKTHKGLFLALSVGAATVLLTSFAYPLQSMEVLRQTELNTFKQRADKIFVITESDIGQPYGLNRKKAVKVSQIYQDYKYQKITLLVTSLILSSIARLMADGAVLYEKINRETQRIIWEEEDEMPAVKPVPKTIDKIVLFTQIKERWQTLSEEQKQLFRAEIRALSEMVESHYAIASLEKNEITDKFIAASYQLEQGEAMDNVITTLWNAEPGTGKHSHIKQELLQWLNK